MSLLSQSKGNRETSSSEEQGYLSSVSDMMSGLLFIFIITLVIFVIKFEQERINAATQKQAFEGQTQALKVEKEALQLTRDDLTDAKWVRSRLLEDLKHSLQVEGVTVRIDEEKGILHVPEDILFQSGRASFLKGGEETLIVLAKQLASKLPCYSGKRGDDCPRICESGDYKPGRLEAVLVEGHTDNVPIHNAQFSDNWALSAERSIVTYQVLMKAALELEVMVNGDGEPLFGVSGYAATRPVVDHKYIHAEPLNRRIDLRFILAPPNINTSEGGDGA